MQTLTTERCVILKHCCPQKMLISSKQDSSFGVLNSSWRDFTQLHCPLKGPVNVQSFLLKRAVLQCIVMNKMGKIDNFLTCTSLQRNEGEEFSTRSVGQAISNCLKNSLSPLINGTFDCPHVCIDQRGGSYRYVNGLCNVLDGFPNIAWIFKVFLFK